MEKPSVEMPTKEFADRVMNLIINEVKAIPMPYDDCDERMIMTLNRIGAGVRKIQFGKDQ